jgi:hypothetical protein
MKTSNFTNLFKSGDFARNNLYDIRFGFIKNQNDFYTKAGRDYDPGDLHFMARNATFPGKSLGTIDTKRFGAIFKVANDAIIDSVSMTIMCSEDMRERLFFEGWINSIYGSTSSNYIQGLGNYSENRKNREKVYRMKYYDDYTTSVYVSSLTRKDLQVGYEVEMFDAYPINIGPIDMSAGTDGEVATFTVTFTMRDWHAVAASTIKYWSQDGGESEGQDLHEWNSLEAKWDAARAEELLNQQFEAADWETDKHDSAIANDYRIEVSSALAKDLIAEHKEARSRHFSDIIMPGDFYRDESGRYQTHEDDVANVQDFNSNAMIVQQKIYQVASKVEADTDNYEARKASRAALKTMQDITVATQNGVEYNPDDFNSRKMKGLVSVNQGILDFDSDRAMVILSEETFGRENLSSEFPPDSNSSISESKIAVVSGVEFDKRSYNLQVISLGKEILKDNANKLDLATPINDSIAFPIEAHKIDHYKKESYDNAAADVSWYEAQKTSDIQDKEIQKEYTKEQDAEAEIAINNASDIQINMEKKYDENARKVQLDHFRDSQIMAHGYKIADSAALAKNLLAKDAMKAEDDLRAETIGGIEFDNKIDSAQQELDQINTFINWPDDNMMHPWMVPWQLIDGEDGELTDPEIDVKGTDKTNFDFFLDGIYDRRRVLENEIINGSINGPEGNGVTFDFTNTPGGDNGLGPFKIFD